MCRIQVCIYGHSALYAIASERCTVNPIYIYISGGLFWYLRLVTLHFLPRGNQPFGVKAIWSICSD